MSAATAEALAPDRSAGGSPPPLDSVVAQVHNGWVLALRVLTHGCE
jgi:hypothetical protein